MEPLTIVVPWRDFGDPYRADAWRWVRAQYEHMFPEARIFLSSPMPWNKTTAVRTALQSINVGIVIVADADSWCEGVRTAVAAVEAGAVWSVPHYRVHRLTRESTDLVLAGKRTDFEELPCKPMPYRGTAAGGVLISRAATFRRVPPDLRFRGWGSEDGAWRDALRTLAGPEWREGTDPLIHFWHPPQNHPRVTSKENHALAKRYVEARGDKRRMRALIEEGLPQ